MKSSVDESTFNAIFYPNSIAVIGASANGDNIGANYFRALVYAGFRGKLFPVSSGGGKLLGYKVYRDIRLLPEELDYAIVAVPATYISDVIDSCADRKVKVVQIYTAGFAEMGHDGLTLQSEIVKRAHKNGVRIIGPNCMGICSPEANIPFGTMVSAGEKGPVAFLSQSGGLTGDMMIMGQERCIRFSKVVSYGNGCDLELHEFLNYFGRDDQTGIVGAYVEDVMDGRRMVQQLQALRGKKPVIICKGGTTEPGTRTTASHTGSLTISHLWSVAITQAGAVTVDSLEALADALVIFQQLKDYSGRRVALISGLSGGGGGVGVLSCDACSNAGLEVPQFTIETQEKLKTILPQVGTILRNPLDMGGSRRPQEVLDACLRTCVTDPQIDLMIVDIHIGKLAGLAGEKEIKNVCNLLIKISQDQPKPLLIILKSGLMPNQCLEAQQYLAQSGLAIFPSVERAARALNLINVWQKLSAG